MIELKKEIRNDNTFPYTFFKCPFCGVVDRFLSISPDKCLHCCKKLPDMRRIETDSAYRMEYYKGA